jgi:putative ABC transport system permease protein
MPAAYRARIEAVPGVTFVSPIVPPPGAWYQDPKNNLNTAVIDPAWLGKDPRFVVPADQLESARRIRTGIVVGRDLAKKHGWKLGDRIPIGSPTPKTDGSTTWEFEIVGLFDFNRDIMGDVPTENVFINYDYFDEARVFDKGQVLLYIARIADPAQTDRVSAEIDRLFQNSGAETRTQSESLFNLTQANEIADVGLIVHGILSAVFFTLVLVAGNTMIQAFRERIPELAVLKTIGFGDERAAGLMVAEALALTVAAGALGMGMAVALVPPVFKLMQPGAPSLPMEPGTAVSGIVAAIGLGLVASVIPAWQARRLTIVAALAAE